ncbi:MAG: hypothetical protein V2I36_05840 [Desulfopila sp.]|jgi:hypothetical protein|nr:hypothetical protein [Desulfopila sp.]
MKTDNNKRINAQKTEMEFLLEKGRQLHSKAVFDVFAGLFCLGKSGKTNTESTGIVNGMHPGAA